MGTFDIHTFVETYTGPKLRMLFTGVGSYATGIIGIAGASKVVDSIYVPYSHEACSNLLRRFYPSGIEVLESHGSVSSEMAVALHACNSVDLGEALPLTVTGAITTSRHRRGENRAYIAVGRPGEMDVWHLKLDKLSEEEHGDEGAVIRKRYVQDRIVSEVAICLAVQTQSTLVSELQDGAHLVRL